MVLFHADTYIGRENENRMITIFAIQIRMRANKLLTLSLAAIRHSETAEDGRSYRPAGLRVERNGQAYLRFFAR